MRRHPNLRCHTLLSISCAAILPGPPVSPRRLGTPFLITHASMHTASPLTHPAQPHMQIHLLSPTPPCESPDPRPTITLWRAYTHSSRTMRMMMILLISVLLASGVAFAPLPPALRGRGTCACADPTPCAHDAIEDETCVSTTECAAC